MIYPVIVIYYGECTPENDLVDLESDAIIASPLELVSPLKAIFQMYMVF